MEKGKYVCPYVWMKLLFMQKTSCDLDKKSLEKIFAFRKVTEYKIK